MSRVLKTGNNQITCTYATHVANANAGNAWARGIDVVKQPSQIDTIIAHSDGTVIKTVDYLGSTNGVADRDGMGYGNYVMIKHSNNYVTVYAHLQSVSVKEGMNVTKGTSIGVMGNTGRSFGAHLHYEVRKYSSTPSYNSLHDVNKFTWLDPTSSLDGELPGTPSPTPSTIVEGFLDTATFSKNNINVSGWAYKDGTTQTVTIKIYSGSSVVMTSTAKNTIARPDVKAAKSYSTDKVGYSKAIDVSTLKDGTYTVKAFVGSTQLKNEKSVVVKKSSSNTIEAGKKINLVNVKGYDTETSVTSSSTKTGTFYLWDATVKNNRIRITNAANRVGVKGQVTCWISTSDVK